MRKSEEEVLEIIAATVARARNLVEDVEWSAMDATRTPIEYLCRCVETAIKAGASTINLPDTVGYATPDEYRNMFQTIRERVPNADKAIFSVHCHDDLGLAVANSLAAVLAGAEQVECTINGIGERAGNAALEEIVMAMRTRPDVFSDVVCEIDTTRIYNASRCVVNVTGSRLQPNKAIVGENAFAHEAGIHQHGMMADTLTYEIMTPESIGVPRRSMVLGKHSGRHAFEKRLAELGFRLEADKVKELFTRFKALADRKKKVTDADIEALARGIRRQAEDVVRLDRFVVTSGNTIASTCTVRLLKEGRALEGVASGDGPISAAFTAINGILELDLALESFQVSAVTGGEDAQGEATVRVRHEGRLYNGHGLSTDVVEAGIRAYLSAINALLAERAEGEGAAHETH
jgi:2-isopropylmalate synthase